MRIAYRLIWAATSTRTPASARCSPRAWPWRSGAVLGRPVVGDHQKKPDVASRIAGGWFNRGDTNM